MIFSHSNFLLVLIFFNAAYADLPLGTRCRLKDSSLGICVSLAECKPVMDQVKSGTIRANPPTICSSTERTVCCPVGIKSTTTTTTAAPVPERLMRISERSEEQFLGIFVNLQEFLKPFTPFLSF